MITNRMTVLPSSPSVVWKSTTAPGHVCVCVCVCVTWAGEHCQTLWSGFHLNLTWKRYGIILHSSISLKHVVKHIVILVFHSSQISHCWSSNASNKMMVFISIMIPKAMWQLCDRNILRKQQYMYSGVIQRRAAEIMGMIMVHPSIHESRCKT